MHQNHSNAIKYDDLHRIQWFHWMRGICSEKRAIIAAMLHYV